MADIYNQNGMKVATVDRGGNVVHAWGSSAGRVERNGDIWSDTGTKLGRADAEGTVWHILTGQKIGRADRSGMLWSHNGLQVGIISPPLEPRIMGGAARIVNLI